MAKLTRRGFIEQTSVSVATIGMLATLPSLAVATDAPDIATETELSSAELSGPLVAHVRDLATGEVGVLFGEREIIFRDVDFVVRLLRATR